MTNKLTEIVRRAESWPEAAQAELAELAREIEAELEAKAYVATRDELDGIARGVRDADRGRFVPDDAVEAVFSKYRR
jgi:predicted transcriptional regulator